MKDTLAMKGGNEIYLVVAKFSRANVPKLFGKWRKGL